MQKLLKNILLDYADHSQLFVHDKPL